MTERVCGLIHVTQAKERDNARSLSQICTARWRGRVRTYENVNEYLPIQSEKNSTFFPKRRESSAAIGFSERDGMKRPSRE